MKWFRPAAEQGLHVAQNNLGRCYLRGVGVGKDELEAVKWIRKAADQGYANAQYDLGSMYEKSQGVPKDENEALKWFRQAAEQGHVAAETKVLIAKAFPNRATNSAGKATLPPISKKQPEPMTGITQVEPMKIQLDKPVTFSDKDENIQITILSILNGAESVKAGRVYSNALQQEMRLGKYAVYLELTCKNARINRDVSFWYSRFTLEGSDETVYGSERTVDQLPFSPGAGPGKNLRGGVVFFLNTNAIPKRLVYKNEGVTFGGKPLEAVYNFP